MGSVRRHEPARVHEGSAADDGSDVDPGGAAVDPVQTLLRHDRARRPAENESHCGSLAACEHAEIIIMVSHNNGSLYCFVRAARQSVEDASASLRHAGALLGELEARLKVSEPKVLESRHQKPDHSSGKSL